jgi:Protein of unknown function (DUF1592)/Protein of unknown function (DUF1588)/Protein of unknown function (DUF1595)
MRMTVARCSLALSLAVGAGLGACGGDDVNFGTGGSGAGSSGGSGGEDPGVFEPADGGVRRMMGHQYVNTIALYFGSTAADALLASDLLPTDNPVSGYAAVGAAQTPPGLSFPEFYDLAADIVADAVIADLQSNGTASHMATYLPCAGEAAPTPACYATFAQQMVPRLFRRPIEQDDVTWITEVANDAYTWANGDFHTGLAYAIRGVLQSPSFLYLVEVGEPDADNPGHNRLTSYELATRMAFFLTDTAPDVQLLDAAGEGGLDSDADIRAEAERLLSAPAAQVTVRRRFNEFLYLDDVMSAQKEATEFPMFDDNVRLAMIEEIERLLDDIVWTRDADIREIYTADYTFVNADLAPIYGVDPPAAGTWEKTTLPAAQKRAGFLSSGAFLTRASHAVRTSPTRRGTFIKDRILCEEVPPPDPGVSTVLPDPGPEPLTTKQLVELHMSDPSCATCHALFDPLGFALENFDAIGQYRTEENGLPIDPNTELWNFGDGPFSSARDMADILMTDELKRTSLCVMLNVFRGAIGHIETDGEMAAFRQLHTTFEEDGYGLRDMLVEMTLNPAFRFVAEGQ